mgnify:CR=1 FL=1
MFKPFKPFKKFGGFVKRHTWDKYQFIKEIEQKAYFGYPISNYERFKYFQITGRRIKRDSYGKKQWQAHKSNEYQTTYYKLYSSRRRRYLKPIFRTYRKAYNYAKKCREYLKIKRFS